MNFLRNIKRLACSAATVAALGTIVTTAVEAKELRIAHGFGPDSSTHQVYAAFSKDLASFSDGALTGRVYPMTLLSFMETASGLRDGIADVGLLVTPYFASDFPVNASVLELSVLAEMTEGDRKAALHAIIGAMTEYALLECTSCHDEYVQQNQVMTALGTTGRYVLLCNKPVTTAADLKGLRMRSGGGYWGRWATSMGATPIQMSGAEIFEGLNQGAIDCNMGSATELTNASFIDVTTHINQTAPGGAFTSSLTNINRSTWQSLSPEMRTAYLRASARAAANAHWQYTDDEAPALALARERGIPIVENDESIAEATRAFIADDLAKLHDDYTKNYGVTSLNESREAVQKLFDKWLPLVEGVETAEQFADLLWEQVHSRIDVNAYGN